MAKIVINIDMDELRSGINQVVDDDMYEAEEEFVCPLSTQDADLNDKNREYAIQEYGYGPSKGGRTKEMCGTCGYYNIRSKMLDCIENGIGMNEGDEVGYCTNLNFICMAENVCNAWEEGGPMTDFDDIDELEPLEGNEKDIL